MKKILLLWMGILFLLPCMNASATIITGPLAIDFRAAGWSDANGSGKHGEHIDGIGDVTVFAMGNSGAGDASLYQDHMDGFGIQGGERDEIDSNELLLVGFSQPTCLGGVWITDLFGAPNGLAGELGQVYLYGNGKSTVLTFSGNDSDQGNGELYVNFAPDFSNIGVEFAAFTIIGDRVNNAFSVAGFTTVAPAPVPEPTTLLLLGCGLIGATGCRRKNK